MSETLTYGTNLKSSAFRRFLKRGPGALIFRSQGYRKLLMLRHFISSYYSAATSPAQFKNVRTYCMFIGHNKSGVSMIGSLLDAHPEAILSDEADALEYVRAGFSRDQIFHILLRQSRREARKGRVTARRLQPYSYQVPGQWQGRYRALRVIGDGTAGSSTRALGVHPQLLEQVNHTLHGVDVKFIQVIRNPYDPISAMMVRSGRSFENAIETYFAYCETLSNLRKQLEPARLLSVRYEDFVRDGESKLAGICEFLGLQAEPDYLKACAGILHTAPETSRQWVKWDAAHIEQVAREMDRHDFLEGYSFE
jgi:hypothetical protein